MRNKFFSATATFLILVSGCFAQVGGGINNPASGTPSGTAGGDLGATYPNPTDLKTTQPVMPTFVSAAASAGSGTSIVVTAPASISNGNILVAALFPQGANSETFTPPAGFAQVGSTLTSTGSGKVQGAVFCKVAASESGNYTFTLGTSAITEWVIWNISGSSCTNDGIGTAAANAQTITTTAPATTLANDIVLYMAGDVSTGNVYLSSPGAIPLSVNRANLKSYYLGNGSGSASTAKFAQGVGASLAGTTNDFVGFAIAFPGTTTASNPTVASSSGAVSTEFAQHITGNVQVDGMIQANGFLMTNSQCDATQASYKNTFSLLNQASIPIPLICQNSTGNIQIDPGLFASAFVQIGNAGSSGATFLVGSGNIFFVSNDISADLPYLSRKVNGAGNDIVVGTTASTSGQNLDMWFERPTGRTFHWNMGTEASDIMTLTSSSLTQSMGLIEAETAGPTNAASSGTLWEDSTAHEWKASTNGASTSGLLVRSQPGAIHQTAQTAAISTATLCAASAGACNTAGEYHIHWTFIETGTACGTPATGGVTFLLTWTDSNATTHSAVSLGMDDASTINAVSQTFHFQTSLAAAWGSGDFNVSTNGSIIQYATGYTACGVGTGTYQLDVAVTRLQ